MFNGEVMYIVRLVRSTTFNMINISQVSSHRYTYKTSFKSQIHTQRHTSSHSYTYKDIQQVTATHTKTYIKSQLHIQRHT